MSINNGARAPTPTPPHDAACHAHASGNAKVRAHVGVAVAHAAANVTCAETCAGACCASTVFGQLPKQPPTTRVSLHHPTPNAWCAYATVMAMAAKWFLWPPMVCVAMCTVPHPVRPWPLPPTCHFRHCGKLGAWNASHLTVMVMATGTVTLVLQMALAARAMPALVVVVLRLVLAHARNSKSLYFISATDASGNPRPLHASSDQIPTLV